MEDYQGACSARQQDVEVLLAVQSVRCVAAAHIGGAAVECRLKALVARYHGIQKWEDLGRRPGDPRINQPIPNPGHSLLSALRLMPDLNRRARLDKKFLEHLGRVMHPAGATTLDFIALRYRGKQFPVGTFADWRTSYRYVVGWLQKNEVIV